MLGDIIINNELLTMKKQGECIHIRNKNYKKGGIGEVTHKQSVA